MKIIAFWIFVTLLSSCDSSNTASDKTGIENSFVEKPLPDSINGNMIPGEDEMFKVMYTMVDQCNQLTMATDLDQNFVKAMIIHHQAGIDMAQLEIAKGQNDELKEIAKDLIANHTSEIKKLQDLVHHHKPEISADDPQNEIYEAMNEMRYKLKKVILTDYTDKNFALLMIPYHGCAVDLAAEEVVNGHHVPLKLFAREMIRKTNKKIERLKDWLDEH